MSCKANCSIRWKIYSYTLTLRKRLLVLGENALCREGLILEKQCEHGSLFSEISPLPSFHRISLKECYQELHDFIEKGIPPKHPINLFALQCVEPQQYSSYQIPCNALGALSNPDDQKTKHFQTVKFKLARNEVSEDVQLLKNWYAKNPEKMIRLDGNRSWSKYQLFNFFEQVSHLPIQYIEDPLSDPNQYSSIQDIPIALDESLVDYPEIINKAPCITHLVIKPTLHSQDQIENFKKMGLPMIFTSTFETSLGLWHIAQLSQRYSPRKTHGFATLDWFKQDICSESIKLHKDNLIIHKTPPIPTPNLLTLEFSK